MSSQPELNSGLNSSQSNSVNISLASVNPSQYILYTNTQGTENLPQYKHNKKLKVENIIELKTSV